MLYLVLISSGMLIVLPWLTGKDNSSTREGVESVGTEENSNTVVIVSNVHLATYRDYYCD